MKHLLAIAAAAVLSTSAFAISAQAMTLSNGDISAIQSLSSGDYSIVRLDTLDYDSEDDNHGARVPAIKAPVEVQQAIRSNATLASELQSRNVQIDNIVAATRAANGDVKFYLR